MGQIQKAYEGKRVKNVALVIFFMAWIICGCSVEEFFNGGAPVVILAALVAIACAIILGGNDE